MRVVIDASPLLVRSAGVKNYLYYWIEHLRRAAGGDVIRTLPPMAGLGGLQHEASVAGRLRTVRGLATLALANYTPLPVLDSCVRGADAFHASVLVRRPPSRTRLTATIHDLTCFLMPELHPAANLRAERSFAEILRRADGLDRGIGIHPQRRGAGAGHRAGEDHGDPLGRGGLPSSIARLRCAEVSAAATGWSGRLCCLWGRSSRARIWTCCWMRSRRCRRSCAREYELVIAGPVGWQAERTVERLRAVRYLGYIPEADLAPLTAAASVFAYPSLYEGFGFPVAQAMAAGVAVITSNVSSLPEVAGDAAVLVDPRSQRRVDERAAAPA